MSERDLEVLSLLADGLTHRQIARELGLQAGTVTNSLLTLRRRLGVESNIQLVAYAFRRGLIT